MIQVTRTFTGKGYGKGDKWQGMGEDTHTFPDKSEALKWLKEQYPVSAWKNKQPMYIDLAMRGTVQIGYIIGYRNDDISHTPVQKWLQQDWVEFQEVREVDMARKKAVKTLPMVQQPLFPE